MTYITDRTRKAIAEINGGARPAYARGGYIPATMTTDLSPGSPAWMRLVTGSKIAPILGISPYDDQYSTWHRMAGNLPGPEVTEAMRRGTFHEGAVLSETKFRHPEWLFTDTRATQQTLEWLAVTPDEVAVDGDDDVLVEVKTTSRWDEWGEPGTDQIPEHYRAQVIVTAHVLYCDRIVIAVMGPYWDYREYLVTPDPALAEAILTSCKDFWDSVQSGIEPALSHELSAYETWTKVGEVGPTGDVEIPPALARDYLDAYAADKRLGGLKAQIVNLLLEDDAKRAVCQGFTIAQRQKSSSGGVALAVARKRPDVNQIIIEGEAA